ncbi:MAG: RecQ family ATP-dependent DNA helicase [Salinivirgaceae bacterium]|nr:RecQ family ATP-dependent DNA helicase [Salinivirgaceae bacterium]
MTRQEAEEILFQTFGIAHFYDEQWAAIDQILKGNRILMIQKTGFGKSLCYQFPATIFSGVTVIFSPLIALMRDQVKSLNSKGISARYINSEQSPEENTQTIQDAINGKIKILYIAPERQENREWIEATQRMNLSMVVVDEAHTISVWGHDFRPAFRRIIDLVNLLPKHLPVLATTATATKRVQSDIERQIGGNLTTIRGDLRRQNFKLFVIRVNSNDEKMIWLAQNLNKIDGTGLIYTGTRVDTEVYAKWLKYVGIKAIDYNAGLDSDTRKEVENNLMNNKYKCVVSTNALGMGIDKPDIRFIIHTQMPASPIHYYQEIGRAGRDGKPTTIILFYNENKDKEGVEEDFKLPKSFIDGGRPAIKLYEKVIQKIKEEPSGERAIVKACNIKSTQFRVIKADLIEQGIIKEVLYDKNKLYEYQFNAKPLDIKSFDDLRNAKMHDLDAMRNYVYTSEPRMKYLCDFLDNETAEEYDNCDNTNLESLTISVTEQWHNKLIEFRESYFPELEVAEVSSKKIKETGDKFEICIPYYKTCVVYKNNMLLGTYKLPYEFDTYTLEEQIILNQLLQDHLSKKARLINGVAASYYGVSNVGNAIHRSKYENAGDFPDFLLRLALKAFRKTFGNQHFDLLVYVPPTHSGDLVKNFAVKFANVLNLPISHNLLKTRETDEQKVFQSAYSKKDNIAGAFDYAEPMEVKNRKIILIDDIFDSGATIKEVGSVLTKYGAEIIAPITIAKTVGGELV